MTAAEDAAATALAETEATAEGYYDDAADAVNGVKATANDAASEATAAATNAASKATTAATTAVDKGEDVKGKTVDYVNTEYEARGLLSH